MYGFCVSRDAAIKLLDCFGHLSVLCVIKRASLMFILVLPSRQSNYDMFVAYKSCIAQFFRFAAVMARYQRRFCVVNKHISNDSKPL